MSDSELTALFDSLPDDHRDAVDSLCGATGEGFADPAARVVAMRAIASRGKVNGGLEQLASILTDPCLATCIESLGKNADNPTEEQLMEIAPSIVERYGLGTFRLTMAASVAGEAAASAMLSRVLRHHDTYSLPEVERTYVPLLPKAEADDATKERRRLAKLAKQSDAARRREQAARARRRT